MHRECDIAHETLCERFFSDSLTSSITLQLQKLWWEHHHKQKPRFHEYKLQRDFAASAMIWKNGIAKEVAHRPNKQICFHLHSRFCYYAI
jgi:hypothetical protein